MGKKKQKGNGTGTVYPRKNKVGKVIGYRGSHVVNGKRYYVSAKTKTETEQKLRQAMTDTDRGLTFDAGGLMLCDFLDRWLNDSVQDTVRDTTFERYEQRAVRADSEGAHQTHPRACQAEEPYPDSCSGVIQREAPIA